jgi:hypothetical protein
MASIYVSNSLLRHLIHSDSNITVCLIHRPMLEGYFDVKITITMVCIIIILSLVLSTIAHGQQFAFLHIKP